MIVAGIGCRRGSSAEAVVNTIHHALEAHSLARDALARLATGSLKQNESGIRAAAHELKLPLDIVDDERLQDVSHRCLTYSQKSIELTGTASLSEAAALAVAGKSARLLGPRISRDGVTCAFAVSGGDA